MRAAASGINQRRIDVLPTVCWPREMLIPYEGKHLGGEPVHLFTLRAALEEDEIDADALELAESLGDPLRRPDEPGAQAAVGHAVVLERDPRLELRSLHEILVARVPARARAHVGDAGKLPLHLRVGRSNDRVRGDAEPERRELRMRRAARAHVLDLRREDLSRVAMHEIGVALASDEVLRRRRLTACVKRWPRLLDRLGVEAGVLDLVVAAGERVLGSRPHPLQDADELSRSRVPLVVFHPCAAVLVALLLPPGAHDVEGEAAAR